jgi:hypothetical protein
MASNIVTVPNLLTFLRMALIRFSQSFVLRLYGLGLGRFYGGGHFPTASTVSSRAGSIRNRSSARFSTQSPTNF